MQCCGDRYFRSWRNKLDKSRGIYDGITACKAIALGGDLIGMAGPLLKEANKSSQALEECLENFILELKTSMMLVGVKNLKELKSNKEIIKLNIN